ncbi:MAG: ribonuclease Y [Candidatus Sericytochromatia bacterium]|nr:ribonuclease Y [Candidatus Sericytochromatia bacterium]
MSSTLYLIVSAGSLLGAAAAVVWGQAKVNDARTRLVLMQQEAENKLSLARRDHEAMLQRQDAALEAARAQARLEARDEAEHVAQADREVLNRDWQALREERARVEHRERDLADREVALSRLHGQVEERLAEVAGLSREHAREQLLARLEESLQRERAERIARAEQDLKDQMATKARDIVTTAIQRTAVDHCIERTVSVVPLPSEDIKGRIIGREGRNIRAIEHATGIDLIIDDTPEAIVLSSFDPVRREVARLALERMIADGRFHPSRIEEQVAKAREEVEEGMRTEGEKALVDLGIVGVHPELVRTLGRLRYRTSYGQNVLAHAREVAHVAAALAAEVGADVETTKRAGLFHDLGKAISHEQEGAHALLGADLAARHGETEAVVHAIRAHHHDVDPRSVEAVLVQVADAVSAARPGARRENVDIYLKRMEGLEAIARSFEGVEKVFAVQAGREVRVVVAPDQVDDVLAARLARDIARRIEDELQYPGQIKVIVIRETRSTEHAR